MSQNFADVASVAAASCSGACLAAWEVVVATTCEAVCLRRAIVIETHESSCAAAAVFATAAAMRRAPKRPSNWAAIGALADVAGVGLVACFAGKRMVVAIGCWVSIAEWTASAVIVDCRQKESRPGGAEVRKRGMVEQ